MTNCVCLGCGEFLRRDRNGLYCPVRWPDEMQKVFRAVVENGMDALDYEPEPVLLQGEEKSIWSKVLRFDLFEFLKR